MQKEIPYLKEWLDLSGNGKFDKAHEIYFEKLFPTVIENFKQRVASEISTGGILFSILGYSPEPIILTAKAIEPVKHIVFTTNNQSESNFYLKQFLNDDFEMIYLAEESFPTIYKALKEQLIFNPSTDITIDITGGKKSMVASTAIFGKDYACRIVYVDFAEYIKELRKPMPGSEFLNIVYDPLKHQPEIKFV